MREKCEECVLFGAWFSLQLDAAFLQNVPFRVARGLGGRTEAAPKAFPGVQPSLSLPHRIAPRKKMSARREAAGIPNRRTLTSAS